jgi:predicted O-linked N-acetylglucosamine transferase (SPINDLY family)
LRGKLAANRASAALFDTAHFVRNLEAAYAEMLSSPARA